VPHSARIWNYWLGGDVNFPVDRDAGDQYRQVYPEIMDAAVASRAFQIRAVRFLAGEAGIRQFLDVGAGLRTPEEIAAFFDRLDLIEPGVVPVPRWRPADSGPPPDLQNFGGVARKPVPALS